MDELEQLRQTWPNSVGVYVEYNYRYNSDLRDFHDPAEVIPELQRSAPTKSGHRAHRDATTSLADIRKWKSRHLTWSQAFEAEGKMPWIAHSARLQTLRYLDTSSFDIDRNMHAKFDQADLLWLIDGGCPTTFWNGAVLDDMNWRKEHMVDAPRARNSSKDSPSGADLNRVIGLMKVVFPHRMRQDLTSGTPSRQTNLPQPWRPIFGGHATDQRRGDNRPSAIPERGAGRGGLTASLADFVDDPTARDSERETRVKADGVFNDDPVGRVGTLETAVDNNREAVNTNTAAIEPLRQRFEAQVEANQRLFEEQVAANQRLFEVQVAANRQLEATVARQATEITELQEKLQRVEEAVGALNSDIGRHVADGISAIDDIQNQINFLWQDNGRLRMEAQQQQNEHMQELAALRAALNGTEQRFDEIEENIDDIAKRVGQGEDWQTENDSASE
jgi:hypothetical protein